jgi:hypothetical protein
MLLTLVAPQQIHHRNPAAQQFLYPLGKERCQVSSFPKTHHLQVSKRQDFKMRIIAYNAKNWLNKALAKIRSW